jgi:hypothetical protein
VDVLDLEATEFFAPQAVIEEGGEQGAVAQAFEELVMRQVHQLPSLLVGDRGRFPFMAVEGS